MNEINFCAHTEWMINNLIYEDQALCTGCFLEESSSFSGAPYLKPKRDIIIIFLEKSEIEYQSNNMI